MNLMKVLFALRGPRTFNARSHIVGQCCLTRSHEDLAGFQASAKRKEWNTRVKRLVLRYKPLTIPEYHGFKKTHPEINYTSRNVPFDISKIFLKTSIQYILHVLNPDMFNPKFFFSKPLGLMPWVGKV